MDWEQKYVFLVFLEKEPNQFFSDGKTHLLPVLVMPQQYLM